MLQKYTRYIILREFFDYPTKFFQMREISRRTKISQPSVLNHLRELVKEGLVLKEKKSVYPTYRANRENEWFRHYKKIDILLRIKDISLLDYLYDNTMPNVIILFGSASKGEDIESSDIDLFIQAPQKKLDLQRYERKINRKINLFFEEDFSKLSNELKNNILNGIILKGYLKFF